MGYFFYMLAHHFTTYSLVKSDKLNLDAWEIIWVVEFNEGNKTDMTWLSSHNHSSSNKKNIKNEAAIDQDKIDTRSSHCNFIWWTKGHSCCQHSHDQLQAGRSHKHISTLTFCWFSSWVYFIHSLCSRESHGRQKHRRSSHSQASGIYWWDYLVSVRKEKWHWKKVLYMHSQSFAIHIHRVQISFPPSIHYVLPLKLCITELIITSNGA